MRFSVLMSVWRKDDPSHLALALRSIYEEQTRKPEEITVVFDGPLTEELYTVLNAFAADKSEVVRYFPQSENRGLGAALRIGMEACTGEYVFRMDADDISAPMRFERQADYLERHPEIDVLGANTAEFESSIDEEMRLCSFPETHEDICKLAHTRNPINHMTVCVRRESVLRCGSYRPLALLEDYYLWLRMMAEGCRFATLQEPLVYVRVGNGFYSRRSADVQIKGWRSLQDFMVEKKMIGRMKRFCNMLTVRVFVRIPPRQKKWVYRVFLRKKGAVVRAK